VNSSAALYCYAYIDRTVTIKSLRKPTELIAVGWSGLIILPYRRIPFLTVQKRYPTKAGTNESFVKKSDSETED